VGDEFAQRVLLHVASHLAHAGAVGGRLFATDTEDTDVFGTKMAVRAEWDFAEIGEVAGFDQQSTDAEHLQGFGNGLGDSGAFDDDIGTATMSEIFYDLQAVGFGSFCHVDGVICTEALGKIQAVVGKVGSNDCARAEHARFHQEAHTERAGAEDDDGIVETEGLVGESGHLLGAVEADGNGKDFGEHGDFVGEVVRDFDEEAAGNDVNVLRPSAEKMRGIFGA